MWIDARAGAPFPPRKFGSSPATRYSRPSQAWAHGVGSGSGCLRGSPMRSIPLDGFLESIFKRRRRTEAETLLRA